MFEEMMMLLIYYLNDFFFNSSKERFLKQRGEVKLIKSIEAIFSRWNKKKKSLIPSRRYFKLKIFFEKQIVDRFNFIMTFTRAIYTNVIYIYI